MLDRRLKLGTFFGVGLYVHWTFALLIAYVGYAHHSEGWVGMAYGIVQLLGVFLCVTLHEYGHAIMARQFGVPTLDITLLPIGGVARLQRMPRVPWQELLVAVAGPAVNVVIAVLIIAALIAMNSLGVLEPIPSPADEQFGFLLETLLTSLTLTGYLLWMLVVNLMLIAFNMIPAFPMDGGRVLRSALAMVMTYRRATYVASRVGLLCAALMAIFALNFGHLMLILIALFIAYAGMAEARQVEVMETVRGLTIASSMIRRPPSIGMDTPLSEVALRWRDLSSTALPVLSMAGTVVGMLRLEDVAKAVRGGADLSHTAGMVADHSVPTVRLGDDLEGVLLRAGQGPRQLPVVDDEDRLTGVLDLDTMLARGVIGSLVPVQPFPAETRFDALQ